MRNRLTIVAVIVSSLLWSSTAMAQHLVDPAALRQAVATQVVVDQQNRQAVLSVLEQSKVREVASRLGLNVTRADAALATMTSAELAELATSARAVQTDLAGGNQTIVISLTTLLLIIIIVILLAN